MPLPGTGFLALWNGSDPERTDYHFWHTREHVAERLGVPGILTARRYFEGRGSLPPTFTLYALENLDVLRSAPYRHLLENPSDWSRSMRPAMRDFLRRGCRLAASFGGGTGGLVAVGLTRLRDEAGALSSLHGMAARRDFTAAHLGIIDETVAGVPFATAEPAGAEGANAVLILEGYDAEGFERACLALAAELMRAGHLEREPRLTFYRLAFDLRASEANAMLRFSRSEA